MGATTAFRRLSMLGGEVFPRRPLVAAIKGVIRSGDKDFAPLQEAGRKKAQDHANKDFLKKCGLHAPLVEQKRCHPDGRFRPGLAVLVLPKAPLLSGNDP